MLASKTLIILSSLALLSSTSLFAVKPKTRYDGTRKDEFQRLPQKRKLTKLEKDIEDIADSEGEPFPKKKKPEIPEVCDEIEDFEDVQQPRQKTMFGKVEEIEEFEDFSPETTSNITSNEVDEIEDSPSPVRKNPSNEKLEEIDNKTEQKIDLCNKNTGQGNMFRPTGWVKKYLEENPQNQDSHQPDMNIRIENIDPEIESEDDSFQLNIPGSDPSQTETLPPLTAKNFCDKIKPRLNGSPEHSGSAETHKMEKPQNSMRNFLANLTTTKNPNPKLSQFNHMSSTDNKNGITGQNTMKKFLQSIILTSK